MPEATTVIVRILDKEYQVSCEPDETDALNASASYVDSKMREFREKSSVFGLDRLAVMVALNIANDFLSHERRADDLTSTQQGDLEALSGKLELAIGRLREP